MTQAQADLPDMPAPQAQPSLSVAEDTARADDAAHEADEGSAVAAESDVEDMPAVGETAADGDGVNEYADEDGSGGSAAATEEGMTENSAAEDDGAPGDMGDMGEATADLDPMRILEALLFAASEPLSTHAIRERMPKSADVGGLLLELRAAYDGRGVQLVEMDGTWAFRTASDLGDALQVNREVKRKLSRAAMETMAIVAYHQPVTRAEIESIRGVATHKGTLDVLIEAGWVKPGRRRETPGRPLTWVTTASFLDQFGLEAITDLPGIEELKASGLLDRRPAIEALGGTGDLFGDDLSAEDADGDAEDDSYDHLAPEAAVEADEADEAGAEAVDADSDPDGGAGGAHDEEDGYGADFGGEDAAADDEGER